MKRFLSVLLMFSLVLLAVACSKPAAETKSPAAASGTSAPAPSPAPSAGGDTIKIGVFEPFTGEKAQGGEMTMKGIELANKQVGEVLGKKVVLVKADNKSDKTEAANAATRLVQKEKVNAIIGSYGSSLSMAAGPIVKAAKVPAVGCSPTNPSVTLGNEYYFRVCFIDPFQGTVMANFATKELKKMNAAVIKNTTNDYSVGLANFFKEAFVKNGGKIVAEAQYTKDDKDFTAQLGAVKNQNPDVIFAPDDYGSSAVLIRQARDMGITAPILGGDTWEAPDFLKIGGESVNKDVFFSSHFSSVKPVNDVSKKFLEDYKAANKEDANAFAALGYDAYMEIIDAIKRANSADPVKIKEAIAATKDFKGATGNITLDKNGDAVKSAVINQVVNGKFEFKMFIEP